MIERRDEELSRIYRDAEGPRPAQRVDDNILAASQRVAGLARRPAAIGFARRWGVPVALAATVLVTSTLALIVYERQSGLDSIAPQVPRAGRPAKASPAEPKRAAQPEKSPPAALPSVAPQPEKSSPAALPRVAPPPAPPVPQAAVPLDRAKQRTVETAFSGKGSATGRSERLPEVPRGFEILRKSEEVKPAPVAPAPGASVSLADLPGANQAAPLQDAPRASEIRQQAPPVAGLASRAGSLRESGPALQGSSVAAVAGNRLAVPEATERTPEKWLEDIRKLKTEGKATEAERELAEFKKRYPDYRLPEDLR
jgi:hypothetical protein